MKIKLTKIQKRKIEGFLCSSFSCVLNQKAIDLFEKLFYNDDFSINELNKLGEILGSLIKLPFLQKNIIPLRQFEEIYNLVLKQKLWIALENEKDFEKIQEDVEDGAYQ